MEELKAYLCKNGKDRIVVAVCGLVFGGVGLYALLNNRTLGFRILGVVMLACFAILEYEALTSRRREARQMQELEDSGMLAAAAREFPNAEQFANDTLRLGQNFVFRKKYPTLLQYRVISEVSTRVRGDNGSEVTMYVKLSDGKSHVLCSLGGDEEQAEVITQRLMAHDAGIERK